MAQLILFVHFSLQLAYAPFERAEDNRLSFLALLAMELVLMAGVLFHQVRANPHSNPNSNPSPNPSPNPNPNPNPNPDPLNPNPNPNPSSDRFHTSCTSCSLASTRRATC